MCELERVMFREVTRENRRGCEALFEGSRRRKGPLVYGLAKMGHVTSTPMWAKNS